MPGTAEVKDFIANLSQHRLSKDCSSFVD